MSKIRTDPRSIRRSIIPLAAPIAAAGGVGNTSLSNLLRWQNAQGSSGISMGARLAIAVRRPWIRALLGAGEKYLGLVKGFITNGDSSNE